MSVVVTVLNLSVIGLGLTLAFLIKGVGTQIQLKCRIDMGGCEVTHFKFAIIVVCAVVAFAGLQSVFLIV